jgi:hypothetical protein
MNENEVGARTTFKLRVYENVEEIYPHFERVSPLQQRYMMSRLAPTEVHETANVVVDGFLDYLIDEINSATARPSTNIEADYIAYGNDDAPPSRSDTALTNEVSRFPVDSISASGTDLVTTSTLTSSQLNGTVLREVGLVHNSSDTLINHALIGPREKRSGETFTVDCNIQFTAL